MRGVRNTVDGIRVVTTDGPPAGGRRVSVASSGICGSDLHLVSLGPSSVTLGHEFCGLLDDGTPVAVLPAVRCGRCPRCIAGEEQQCSAALGMTYGVSLDGGLADEVWVDDTCTTVLPSSIRLDDACLVEPIAVALHGVHRAGVTSGSRVLVIGAGPIGLCAIAAALDLGASVDLVAHGPRRIEAGERLGATSSQEADYDIVLEAAGTQASMDKAFECVRPGGTIGVLSNFWEPVTVSFAFQLKEVDLVPAFTYGHHHGVSEFEEAVRMLDATPDLPDAIISHRFSLDDSAEAFRVAADRSTGAIKVVVHP